MRPESKWVCLGEHRVSLSWGCGEAAAHRRWGVAGRQNLPLCQCGVQGMQWEEGEGEGGGESWGRGKGKRGE